MEKETALQILKEIHDNGIFSVRTALETLISELAESEEEKIRKELIKVFSNREKYLIDQSFGDITVSEVLAWLENIPYTIDHEKREGFRLGYKAGLEKQGEKDRFIKEEIECIKGYRENAIKKLEELEKQGEQKFEMKSAEESLGISSEEYNDIVNECLYGESNSSDMVEPKFKVGDWITDCEAVFQITNYDIDYGYQLVTPKGTSFHFSDENVENKYHLWTIEDAKDGDILMANAPFIFNGNLEGGIGCPGAHCAINTLGKFQIPKYKTHWTGHITTPATKEQRDQLEKAMTDAGYEFDFEKKELKKIEQNPADKCVGCNNVKGCVTCVDGSEWAHISEQKPSWSEEDLEMFESIEESLDFYRTKVMCDKDYALANIVSKEISWLKSLKDRVQPIHEYSDTEKQEIFLRSQRPHFWRPSDKQMKALCYVFQHYTPNVSDSLAWDSIKTLELMYQDLKKLKA